MLKERVSGLFGGFEVEVDPGMVENDVARGRVLTLFVEWGDRGSVSGRADEELEELFGIDFSVPTEIKRKSTGE